jgi:hypothetical protein
MQKPGRPMTRSTRANLGETRHIYIYINFTNSSSKRKVKVSALISFFAKLEGCRWRSNQRLLLMRRWNSAAGNIDGRGLLMIGVGVKDGLVRVVLMVELRWRETIGMGWGGMGIYCLTENEKARRIDCPLLVWRQ